MITQVEIQNFKSLKTLSLQLGRINVLIGENGSGKSNLLEAIALGAAAASNKLDNEFPCSRGIQVTKNPIFMRAAFNPDNITKEIPISFTLNDGIECKFELSNDNKPYTNWVESTYGSRMRVSELTARLEELVRSGTISNDTEVSSTVLRDIMREIRPFSYLQVAPVAPDKAGVAPVS